MNAMELGSLWSQARAVHPDDQARQNESFMAALGVFAELATAKERIARIEAQQRLADAQELAAKAGLAHMKAVAAEREACEDRVVSLFEVLETPYLPDITRAIRARGTPRHNNGEHDAI